MQSNSWNIFSDWKSNFSNKKITFHTNWDFFNDWEISLSKYKQLRIDKLNNILSTWNDKLNFIGADTYKIDFINFRPLRLSREEDWSDWLAHLIATSETGYLSKHLLKLNKFDETHYVTPYCEREILYEGYRSDIIIRWINGNFTHIEVKIGDMGLEKTYDTALKMRKKYGASNNWYDFILLLETQVENWLNINNDSTPISYITWHEVALQIRKSLIHSEESVFWKVWAFTFLGAIEQLLLGFYNSKAKNIINVPLIDKQISLLTEGLNNG